FYVINMDIMDIVLGYPWLEILGTININVQKKFMKIWCKRKKVTLQNIILSKEQRNVKMEHEDDFEDGEEGNKDDSKGEHDEKEETNYSSTEEKKK
ncbi:hypothetical protein KI387_025256, partial [Taxus chinensis]